MHNVKNVSAEYQILSPIMTIETLNRARAEAAIVALEAEYRILAASGSAHETVKARIAAIETEIFSLLA